ncbi:polymorphic toxin type 43 domain-containing protein [Saccharomonospora sp. NPDC046836]|uniref:polymorphic toxin type 43 domain-containing protein n=1 Tax=Saccharomonospora sp. NPDC046836 TaxID=3156921 RepID=UPI003403B169
MSYCIEVSSRTKSTAALRNYVPSGGREFVFDPTRNRFAVGKPARHLGIDGSPHQKLARSIGADEDRVLGGTWMWVDGGKLATDEVSGHYGDRWTPELRAQFVDVMKGYGLDVSHTKWGF